MGPDCTRKYLKSVSYTTPTVWAIWFGVNFRTGAVVTTGQIPITSSPVPRYITQWLEVIERDYSHPSIIGWCPLNETWQMLEDRISVLDDVTRGMFLATKALDQTRPVLDASGYSHRVPESDIYDSHNYEQDVETFSTAMAGLAMVSPFINQHDGKTISIPLPRPALFCQRVWRHLVEPGCQAGRRFVGVWKSSHQPGGVLPTL